MKNRNLNRTVVIDNGSGSCKVGFSNDKIPRLEFPTFYGEPKHNATIFNRSTANFYVGSEALQKRGILNLRNPIQHGIITNWEDMEKIWSHIFHKELNINCNEFSVLITDAPFNPISNREKMTEIFFENFQFSSLYISIQAILSLYSSGSITGSVLDSGDGVTHCVPIYEGYSLNHSIKRLDFAGRDLNEYLIVLLNQKGYKFISSSEKEIVRNIKETECFVSYEPSIEKIEDKNYTLPDGTVICLGDERYKCPELLFDPSLAGYQFQNIQTLVSESIKSCDVDLRQGLFSNVVLSGGSTLFSGIDRRLTNELKNLNPTAKIGVCAHENRKYGVWIGGSILASLSSFKNMLVTKKEYQEYGNAIIRKKIF